MRHFVSDLLYLRHIFRIESETAGAVHQQRECALCLAGFLFFFFGQQSDRVDQNIVLLRFAHQSLQADDAGIVVTIGHHQNHLFVPFRLLLEVIDGHSDRIAHGGPAARVDLGESLLQHLDIAGEVGVQIRFIVEIHDESLVLRVGIPNQGQSGLFHRLALLPHAAGIVDDQAKGYRHVFVLKVFDLLQHAVLENRKGAAGQIRDQVTGFVGDGHIQRHEASLGGKHRVVRLRFRLTLWRRRRRRNLHRLNLRKDNDRGQHRCRPGQKRRSRK